MAEAQLTKEDYAKKHGVSVRTVERKIKEGSLNAAYKKKRCYIIEKAEIPQETLTSKERLQEAQIKKIELQNEERIWKIRKEFWEELKDKLMEAFQPLTEAFAECKLTKEQSEKINDAMRKSLDALKSL